jgi:hypothetical protein
MPSQNDRHFHDLCLQLQSDKSREGLNALDELLEYFSIKENADALSTDLVSLFFKSYFIQLDKLRRAVKEGKRATASQQLEKVGRVMRHVLSCCDSHLDSPKLIKQLFRNVSDIVHRSFAENDTLILEIVKVLNTLFTRRSFRDHLSQEYFKVIVYFCLDNFLGEFGSKQTHNGKGFENLNFARKGIIVESAKLFPYLLVSMNLERLGAHFVTEILDGLEGYFKGASSNDTLVGQHVWTSLNYLFLKYHVSYKAIFELRVNFFGDEAATFMTSTNAMVRAQAIRFLRFCFYLENQNVSWEPILQTVKELLLSRTAHVIPLRHLRLNHQAPLSPNTYCKTLFSLRKDTTDSKVFETWILLDLFALIHSRLDKEDADNVSFSLCNMLDVIQRTDKTAMILQMLVFLCDTSNVSPSHVIKNGFMKELLSLIDSTNETLNTWISLLMSYLILFNQREMKDAIPESWSKVSFGLSSPKMRESLSILGVHILRSMECIGSITSVNMDEIVDIIESVSDAPGPFFLNFLCELSALELFKTRWRKFRQQILSWFSRTVGCHTYSPTVDDIFYYSTIITRLFLGRLSLPFEAIKHTNSEEWYNEAFFQDWTLLYRNVIQKGHHALATNSPEPNPIIKMEHLDAADVDSLLSFCNRLLTRLPLDSDSTCKGSIRNVFFAMLTLCTIYDVWRTSAEWKDKTQVIPKRTKDIMSHIATIVDKTALFTASTKESISDKVKILEMFTVLTCPNPGFFHRTISICTSDRKYKAQFFEALNLDKVIHKLFTATTNMLQELTEGPIHDDLEPDTVIFRNGSSSSRVTLYCIEYHVDDIHSLDDPQSFIRDFCVQMGLLSFLMSGQRGHPTNQMAQKFLLEQCHSASTAPLATATNLVPFISLIAETNGCEAFFKLHFHSIGEGFASFKYETDGSFYVYACTCLVELIKHHSLPQDSSELRPMIESLAAWLLKKRNDFGHELIIRCIDLFDEIVDKNLKFDKVKEHEMFASLAEMIDHSNILVRGRLVDLIIKRLNCFVDDCLLLDYCIKRLNCENRTYAETYSYLFARLAITTPEFVATSLFQIVSNHGHKVGDRKALINQIASSLGYQSSHLILKENALYILFKWFEENIDFGNFPFPIFNASNYPQFVELFEAEVVVQAMLAAESGNPIPVKRWPSFHSSVCENLHEILAHIVCRQISKSGRLELTFLETLMGAHFSDSQTREALTLAACYIPFCLEVDTQDEFTTITSKSPLRWESSIVYQALKKVFTMLHTSFCAFFDSSRLLLIILLAHVNIQKTHAMTEKERQVRVLELVLSNLDLAQLHTVVLRSLGHLLNNIILDKALRRRFSKLILYLIRKDSRHVLLQHALPVVIQQLIDMSNLCTKSDQAQETLLKDIFKDGVRLIGQDKSVEKILILNLEPLLHEANTSIALPKDELQTYLGRVNRSQTSAFRLQGYGDPRKPLDSPKVKYLHKAIQSCMLNDKIEPEIIIDKLNRSFLNYFQERNTSTLSVEYCIEASKLLSALLPTFLTSKCNLLGEKLPKYHGISKFSSSLDFIIEYLYHSMQSTNMELVSYEASCHLFVTSND